MRRLILFFIFLIIFQNAYTIDYKAKFDSLKTEFENREQAEKNEHQFKAFLQKDGYPKIKQIHFKDKDGYIWMSEHNEDKKNFYRFDGLEFENITNNYSLPNHDQFEQIIDDGSGTPYFRCKNGIAKWDGFDIEYIHFSEPDTLIDIYCNNNGTVFYLCKNGIAKWDSCSFNYNTVEDKNNNYKLKFILLVDSKGRIWGMSEKKENKKTIINPFYICNNKISILEDLEINASEFLTNNKIIEDDTGNILLLVNGNLFLFKENLEPFSTKNDKLFENIRDIIKDKNNNLWCLNSEFKDDKITLINIFYDQEKENYSSTSFNFETSDYYFDITDLDNFIGLYSTNNILLFNLINNDFVDINLELNNSFLLGSKYSFLNCFYLLDKRGFPFFFSRDKLNLFINKEIETYHLPYDDEIISILPCNNSYIILGKNQGVYQFSFNESMEKIADKSSRDLNKISDGSIIFSIEEKGIRYLKNGKIRIWNNPFGKDDYLTSFIVEDPEKSLWFRTKKNNLVYLKKGKWEKTNIQSEEIELILDNEKKLWLITKEDIYEFSDNDFIRNPISDSIKLGDVKYGISIHKDNKKNFWINTNISAFQNSVLYRLNLDSKVIKKYPGNILNTIFTDEDNQIFLSFSTLRGSNSEFESGIYQYKNEKFIKNDTLPFFWGCFFDGKLKKNKYWFESWSWFASYSNGVTKIYNISDGLCSNRIRNAIEDLNGDLWFQSKNGISKYNSKTDKFISFTKEDGLPSNIYNIEIDDIGSILLATNEGLIKFKEPEYNANPIISYLQADTLRFFQNDEIKLPFTINSIKIKYKAVTLQFPEKIKYSVFLEGFSEDWSEYSLMREKQYEQLPFGKYTFKFKAMLKNGKILEGPSISFTILPPWYKTWWFYTLLILIVVALLYLIYKARVRILEKNQEKLEKEVENRTHQLKEAYSQIEKEKAKVEEKNIKLVDSIAYASLIQHSILPRDEEISQYIKDYFIIWKPRDIVGGDFYWFYPIPKSVTLSEVEGQNSSYIISVIDCTGHGVPGAFMSMTANSILNNIIKEKQIYEPDKILNLLHKEIRYTLRQQSKESQQDGMDISLCYINVKTQEIHFAGAMQTLYLLSKNESTESTNLIKIKGNRFSIGGKQKEEERIFTKHTINYRSGDTIYLMSDGLADQKVRIDGREQRFKTKRVEAMLLKYFSLSMSEQKRKIEEELTKVQSDFEQRDDITVWGVKL